MKIGQFIMNYRNEHDLSQRDFAKKSGISNSLISMLEKGFNPKTKKPIELSIASYRKIAQATGITVDELFSVLGPDAPVRIDNPRGMSFSIPVHRFDQAITQMVESSLSESETKRQIRDRERQNELKLIKIFDSLTPEGQEYLLQQADIAKQMFGKK